MLKKGGQKVRKLGAGIAEIQLPGEPDMKEGEGSQDWKEGRSLGPYTQKLC